MLRGTGHDRHRRAASLGGRAASLALSVVTLAAVSAQSTPERAPLPPSALPLRLIGIVFDEDQPVKSACLIRCGDQPQRGGILTPGERACDVAVVREVRQDAVVIQNLEANRLELLTFSNATLPAAARSHGAVSVQVAAPPEAVPVLLPQEAVQETLANLPDLLSSALAIPRYRETVGGQRSIEGFEVTQVRPSGAAERLGLRNGDVILEVNGQLLDGMPTVMRLIDQLQAAPQVKVTVLRDGHRMNVVLNTR